MPSCKTGPCLLLILLHFLASFFSFSSSSHHRNTKSSKQNLTVVKVGVVGDLDSPFGMMMSLCMDMAISDFYSTHPHYRTRLQLRKTDAKSVLDYNLAILELAEREEIVGILGFERSSKDALAADIGASHGIPIISFTERSSALSYAENNYFVRSTLDDAVQAEALAAICQQFQWTKVVVLYEDTRYRFLSHSIKAFQRVDIHFDHVVSISKSAQGSDILKELNKLKGKQTKVFLVHLNPKLGIRLFELAKKMGMMKKEYAWIITDSISIFLKSGKYNTNGSMDGVLGVRPYILDSKNLDTFQRRWRQNNLVNNISSPILELNIYGLWAYDAVTALAIAVEEATLENFTSLEADTTKDEIDSIGLRISSYGTRILRKLLSTKFRGLTGDFQLAEGKLNSSAYEIFNVVASGEKRVGFWTRETGIAQGLHKDDVPTSTKDLREIMWPGGSAIPPKGWKIPATGHLRVGIPWKRGFKDFIDVKTDPITNHTIATGFVVDIFLKVLDALPFPISYEFHCYNLSKSMNLSYNNMLQMIPQEYDMVLGDTTIWTPRTEYVDFSLPYSESGIVIVVQNKKQTDMFIKPLRWDLWLAIIIACIFMGIIFHILERNHSVTKTDGSPQLAQRRTSYLSPIEALAFPERQMVSNKWSAFTLVCWLFMAVILMQSFTASLSAMLTVDQLKFGFSDDYYVGYHEGSFMKSFLTEQMHLSESRIRPYTSLEEYHEAMSKGGKNGGIDVIFDELPYMKLFLNQHQSIYKIVGPTYTAHGFGFAFEKGSPLVAYFSNAILNVTQGPEIAYLQEKYFGPGYSSHDVEEGPSSLTLQQFGGLFLTIGLLTLLALFCSETSIGRKVSGAIPHFINNGFSYRTRVLSMKDTSDDAEDTTNSVSSHSVDTIVVAESSNVNDANNACAHSLDTIVDAESAKVGRANIAS